MLLTSRSRRGPGETVAIAGCLALVPVTCAALLLWEFMVIGAIGAPPHGHIPAVDFAAFWGAARLVMQGHAGDVYDWPLLSGLLVRWLGAPLHNTLPLYYPPPFFMLLAPLGLVSYRTAFAIWAALGMSLYLATAWAILPRKGALLVALAVPGEVACLQLGQNGLLSAAAVGAGLLLLERRPFLAGMLLGLLCCKPQLAFLAPVALAAGGHWRALRGAALSTAAVTSLALGLFGLPIFMTFLHAAGAARASFVGAGWVYWCNVQTIYGSLRVLRIASTWALAAQAVVACACAVWLTRIWRSSSPIEPKAAALASAALLATPYVFLYDSVWLGVAAVFLLRDVARRGGVKRWEAALLIAGYIAPFMQLVVPAVPLSSLVVLGFASARAGLTPLRERAPATRTSAWLKPILAWPFSAAAEAEQTG